MQDELAAIDVSPLEALMGIKAELETLESRLAAMEERKATVAAAVYQRVRGDYEARRRQLEADAAPLKASARSEYAKLATLLSRSEADHEAARLDREEIEFRHALGEFDDAEFKRRIGAVDEQLAAKAAAREQALALRQRFVAAFRSEDELLAAAPAAPAPAPKAEPAPAAAPAPAPAPPAAPELPPGDMPTRRLPTLDPAALEVPKIDVPTLVAKPVSAEPPPLPNAPAGGVTAGATQILRAIKPSDLAAAAAAATPVPAAKSADPTMVVRSGRLVPQNPEAGKLSHTIGAKPLLIGSGESCDIRVSGASARHAEVRASMAGITVSDLGGGVRINGVVIEQHLLRHDDVLEIGAARFTFREA